MRDGCLTRIAREKRFTRHFGARWTGQRESFPQYIRITTQVIRRVASVSVFPLADFFMAQRTDVERGRAIVERWRALAEQRLDYLIALQESGRWQRFHSEPDFLDNLRDARDAVETWRLLASREASLDNRPIDFAWLGQGAVPLAQRDIVKRDDCAMGATPIASPPVAPAIDGPSAADALPLSGQAASLDLTTMQNRYPLLRNAL